MAAKSRDSSGDEMPFGLIPELSKHSSHTRFIQRSGPSHPDQVNWLITELYTISPPLSKDEELKPSVIGDLYFMDQK